MRYLKMIITLLLVGLSCSTSILAQEKSNTIVVKSSDVIQTKIGVKGMTCVGCEVSLERSISKVPGVVKAKASASNDTAVIEYDKTKTDVESIMKNIKKSGYTPFKIVEKTK